jgi:hypothetical protein
MKTIDRLFLANSVIYHAKQASTNIFQAEAKSPGLLGQGANLAATMLIPGYGAVTSGMDALKAISQGNIWGGLGHTALAGLSMLPGIGTMGAGAFRLLGKSIPKAVPILGRLGSKGLAPNIGKLGERGINALQNISDWGLKKLPYGKSIANWGPGRQGAAFLGGGYLGNKMINYGEENMAEREAEKQRAAEFMPNFRNWAQSNVVGNPMYARPYQSLSDTAREFGGGVQNAFGRMF